jgi:hypothetical protein
MLWKVGIRQLGTRTFLVGQVADDDKNPDPRAVGTYWFPIDDVVMLTVYPDVRAARAAYAAWGKQPAETDPKQSRWPWRK